MRILRWISNIWMVVLILNLVLTTALVGGRMVVPRLATPATLRSTEPANGSQQVPVRARAVLQFDRPMNPRSVEAALQIEPETAAILIWDAAFTTLTISPTLNLRSATDYQITLRASAMERSLRPLVAPIKLAFHTVAAPAVRATIPAADSSNMLPVAPIVISFSRPMVPPTAVLHDTSFAGLRFEPPIVGRTLWIDQSTLLFQIETSLAPATEYRATLAADLTDLGGGPLGQPYSWTFRVAVPTIVATNPAHASRDIALRTPLTITLTQALPNTQLRQALQISPTIDGALQSTILPDQRQLVTFTPDSGWQPATNYQVQMQLADQLLGSFNFRTAPRLALTGRFPGEAQILPLNQPIRLIFSTSVEPELLRAALRFNPPIEQFQITGSGSELQVRAALRTATPYTLTIAPDLTDRNGTTLGITAIMRFQTAPAQPALTLPETTAHLAQFLPNRPIDLLVRRTNLSALSLDLFDMDEATVVRTRVFSASDWQGFDPERYQQPLRRSWSVPLSDTLNGVVEDRLAITDANATALAPGLYYLRIRSPEGPRADLVFSVTNTQLNMQIDQYGALIWATDALSGTVLPNLPLALYQDDVLILEGITDTAGILRTNLAGGQPHTYTVLARSPTEALYSIGSLTLPSSTTRQDYQLTTISNGSRFAPGTDLLATGFVREVVTSTLKLPNTTLTVQLQLRDIHGRTIQTAQATTDPTGAYSATLALPNELVSGQYQLLSSVAGVSQAQAILIEQPTANQDQIQIELLRPHSAETPVQARISATTNRGLPLASMPISWTLSATVVAAPLPTGYHVGLSGSALPTVLQGNATTDTAGHITLPISVTATTTNLPLRYRLQVGIDNTEASAIFITHPASVYLGIQAERLIAPNRGTWAINLLAVDPQGKPIGRQSLQLQLLAANQANVQPLISRRVTSATDGTIRLELAAPSAGAFVLRVATNDRQGNPAISELPLWAAGTPTILPATALLIADRSSYTAGEVATLLPVVPQANATGLIVISSGTNQRSEVRTIQSGVPFTITLANDANGDTQVSLRTSATTKAASSSAAVILPLACCIDTIQRLVASPSQPFVPQLRLSSDTTRYTPGATAIITATSRTTATTMLIGLFTDPPGYPNTRPAFYWSGPISSTTGSVTLNVPLPAVLGPIYAIAWDGTTQATLELAVQQPLAVYLDPPSFVRPGDQFELPARIVNTTDTTTTVTIELQSDQFKPQSAAQFSQTISLAPASSMQVAFAGIANAGPQIALRLQASNGREIAIDTAQIIVLTDTTVIAAGGGLVTSSYHSLIPGHPQGTLTIDIAGTPDAIVLAAARSIAMLPVRTVREEAALLLISAILSDTHELANTSIARLAASQNADGGWGWWPTFRSDPEVTAAVLEALAAATQARLRVPDRMRTSALTWAERNLDAPIVTQQRLELAYALRLHQRPTTTLLNELSTRTETLSPHEAALLALALPTDAEQARSAALTRLVSLAQREHGVAFWPSDLQQPEHSVEVTALALQALQQADLEAGLRSEALAALASWRTPTGWGDPTSTARAISAVRAAWLVTQPSLQFSIDLNNERLLAQAGGVLTTTQQLQIPAARLSSTNTLTVTTSSEPLFLSYQLTAPGTTAPDADAVLIVQEVINPQTGNPIISGIPLPDQPTDVHLILIVQRQLGYAQLEIGLPPGASIQRLPDSLPWSLVVQTADRIVFAQDATAPGVYEVRYQIQPGLHGQFMLPAPIIRDQRARVISVVQAKR